MISAAVLLYSELTAAQTVTAAMAVRWCAVKRVTAGRHGTDSTRHSPAHSCGKHCNADYCETKLVLRVREQRTVSIWNRPLCWKHSSVIFISANAFCVFWPNDWIWFDTLSDPWSGFLINDDNESEQWNNSFHWETMVCCLRKVVWENH